MTERQRGSSRVRRACASGRRVAVVALADPYMSVWQGTVSAGAAASSSVVVERPGLPSVASIVCPGAKMVDLSAVDLDELATALGDQGYFEHRRLIDPDSGEISLWTEDGGIDGEHPVDLDDVDLICIDPLPSYVWYQDMADFADRISDDRAGRRLARAIRGVAPSDGSRTNSMRSIRISCRPGTPFVTPTPSVVPWSGLLTTTLSTRRRPSNTFPRIRNRPCRNLRLAPYQVASPKGELPLSRRRLPANRCVTLRSRSRLTFARRTASTAGGRLARWIV